MKDRELNDLLKSAPVPDRAPEYWERFPRQVADRLRQEPAGRAARLDKFVARPGGSLLPALWRALIRDLTRRPAFGMGLVAVCLAIGFAFGFWHGRQATATERQQLAEARRCFHEIAALFPHQLQALEFSEQGPKLVLAEAANVPASPPVYLKITGPRGSVRFVTFSGQQIRVDGEVFDVLVDRQGAVLVVGAQWAWSSAEPAAKAGRFRVEARPLPLTS
jgi:hypothetical protein